VTSAAKKFFYLVAVLILISVLRSAQSAGSAAAPDPPPRALAQANTARADASGVIFLSNDQVSQTFAKGATLYNGNPERNYRVHIFHRDTPGEVEVHSQDTDILYILEGSATFITGGTIAGGKETAPDEIRLASMDGGVVRRLTKGDVIIVPARVPHWFKEVQQPITYLGVKVR
jgi:quercetin dioxygenase-like cupin family protein